MSAAVLLAGARYLSAEAETELLRRFSELAATAS